MNNQLSSRLRFLFDDVPVRGVHVKLDHVWQEIKNQKNYPNVIEQVLGELLAAGVLLSSNLKFDGSLILQVQGQGALKLLVVEVNTHLTCRATARWQDDLISSLPDTASLQDLVGSAGQFVMTLQPTQGEAWQGIVAISGQSIAQMLMNYMTQSEQLSTHIKLACDEQSATGLLLQKLPEPQYSEENEEKWQTLSLLSQTLTTQELLILDAQTILHRLFHEHQVRVFEAEQFEFACTCSHEKVSDMLKLLGGQEVGLTILEQGSIEVACDFCQKQYVFDEEDASDIFGMNVVQAVQEAHEKGQENITH
ncbi:Hsp33 family molecular chaperone HslO [Neisseria sp. Ec49-e6-T10]|uniref:Hsp33 family molecular chaperone HslO n=1 Tax=Neisseria sp. Ec49-e6-T10 TaxID=3140744 RepID=UPI003EBCC722